MEQVVSGQGSSALRYGRRRMTRWRSACREGVFLCGTDWGQGPWLVTAVARAVKTSTGLRFSSQFARGL